MRGQWGFQLDGGAGTLDNRAFESGVGRLFWRNPSRGLLGAYVSYTHWDQYGGVQAAQAAGEFEAYRGRWTLRGIVGAEFGNSASTFSTTTSVTPPAIGIPGAINTVVLTQSYDVKTRFMDQINLQYYVTDNWHAYIGHRYLGGKNALALGSELGLPLGRGVMASAFVEGRIGSASFEGVWGGLRFYFGQKDKTLIRRCREDGVCPWDILPSIVNNSNQNVSSSSQRTAPLSPPPPPPPPPQASSAAAAAASAAAAAAAAIRQCRRLLLCCGASASGSDAVDPLARSDRFKVNREVKIETSCYGRRRDARQACAWREQCRRLRASDII